MVERALSLGLEGPRTLVGRAESKDLTLCPTDYVSSLLFSLLGWDPIFEYHNRTYAEMEKEEKVRAPVVWP